MTVFYIIWAAGTVLYLYRHQHRLSAFVLCEALMWPIWVGALLFVMLVLVLAKIAFK